MLRVHFFGEFRVWRGEVELTPQLTHLGKPKTLLKILAAHPGRCFTADELAEWLWPKISAELATLNVRKRISELRQVLEPKLTRGIHSHYILSKRESGYFFNPTIEWETDTAQCTQHYEEAQRLAQASQFSMAVSECEAALTPMQGEFLAEDRYADWAEAIRQEWDERFLNILDLLAESHARLGQYEPALASCRRALQKAPTRENFHRRLMLYHYLKGNKAEALHAYRECCHTLHEALEVAPSAETTQLHQRILQEEVLTQARSIPHNLPSPLTSFIGRERELTETRWLLSTTRLLTLIGIGGCGKTRLALQLAHLLLPEYPDGVWWVSLASLTDERRLPQAIATALGIRETQGNHVLHKLKETLREKNLLVILDNCEHLAKGCAQLAEDLLISCSHLQILVTSREALRLIGETVWIVPPLETPNLAVLPALKILRQIESVTLFIERALTSQPKFNLTKENAPSVAQICAQLDGIPLAIELAAARVRALSVEQIATRLIERFDLLREESSSTLPQHQTLQAAMDWSYQLISPQEQCLLQRLSVFVGGWPLEAAEALGSDLQTPPAPSSAPSIAPLAPQEIFHLLTSLIDKSLVIAETHNKEARYRLLETVREYSLEKLSRASQVMALRDRHLDFFLKLLDHAMTEIRGPKQSEWITRIALEYGNIQSALHWAKKSPELGLRLAISLMRFWEVQGYYKEGQEWLEKFAAYLEAPSLWRARALSCAGIFARLQCDYATAYQLFGQSLALREAINDRRGIAEVLNNRGLVAYNEGNYEKASADFEKSLAIKHEFGDKLAIANSLVNLGMVAKEKADYASAQAYYEQCLSLRQEVGDQFGIADALHSLAIIFYEQSAYLDAQTFCQQSLAIRRKLNNRLGIAMSLNQLGMIAAAQSEHTRARALYEESLAIKCELGDKRGSANTLNNLGLVAHDAGDYNAAASYYQKSLATKREIGDQHGIANTLHNLGVLALDQQKCTDASSLLKESLLIRRQVGDKQGIAKSLEGFARLQHRHSQLEAAVQLLGAAEALREAIHSPIEAKERRELEAAIRLICEALGENNFQREISKGRNLTLEQAIECALAFQI